MKLCENCKKEHKGTYGSGRFCSNKCAKGFSTKEKRSLINEKVSKKLKGTGKILKEQICLICKTTFKPKKKNQTFCSRSCAARGLSEESKQVIRLKMIGKNTGSKNGMYGKTPKNTKRIKVFSNKHNGKKIFNVKSSYEKRLIDELNNDNSVISFKYEPKEFKVFYKDKNGTERTYQPDFLINTNKIIEMKNKWSITLEETKEKESAFKKYFPHIEYILTKY